MRNQKNEAGNLLPITVIEGIIVNVLPSSQHEFLLSTIDVAVGYGVTAYNIRRHKLEHSHELIEGKHFISNVSIPHAANKGTSRGTFWTKRGIIRLGFFVKSERAKLFRDWAEELIINVSDHLPDVRKMISTPERKTKANRLTQERLLDIMADVCQIDDRELRLKISNKLMGGQSNGTI